MKNNFSIDDAKELVDYLWFIRNYNFMGAKILSSIAENTAHMFQIHHNELFVV